MHLQTALIVIEQDYIDVNFKIQTIYLGTVYLNT